MISAPRIRSAFSNEYATALAAGDPRMQMKKYDRGGLSRGAGQVSQAGMQGAAQMAEGIANAYATKRNAQDYNNAYSIQSQQADMSQLQALQGLYQQQAYNDQMAAQQQRNSALDFATSILGGLLS